MPTLPRLLPAALLLIVAGCRHVPAGRLENESRSVDAGKAEMVHAEVTFGAGELKMSGGARKLMEADFEYNIPAWKPGVRYEETGFRGRLSIRQPAGTSSMGHAENRWGIRLSDSVPIDMQVRMGAGDARLELASLSLRGLDIEMGAGKLELDMTGDYKKNFDVRVRGGVGEATLRLPSRVGVCVNAVGGIGEISVRGLHKDGGCYANSVYGKSKVTVSVDVKGGVGQINLISE